MQLTGNVLPNPGLASASAYKSTPAPSERSEITLGQRMVSACVGALVTSVVVTPFDVIRIRIQQQEVLPSGVCCGAGGPVLPQSGRNTLARVAPSSALSGSCLPAGLAAAAKTPDVFWMLKAYCSPGTNHHPQCTRIDSTLRGFVTIPRQEGAKTLWRGLSLTLLMAVPSNVIYYSGYEYLRDHSPIASLPLNPLFCGSVSRVVAACCISPLELLKTRFQSIPGEPNASQSSDLLRRLLREMRMAVQQGGPKPLFTGLGLTLWRDVPFSGIYWMTYETLKAQIGGFMRRETVTGGAPSENKTVLVSSFLAGSVSGTVAAFFTNPFDVGKTRMQIMTLKSPSRTPRGNVMAYMLQILRTEGMGALYSGFAPRVMKIAPACAIMISTYEVGKKVFEAPVPAVAFTK